ncbi:uncharacterized protein ofcc1 [Mustelus asterias]
MFWIVEWSGTPQPVQIQLKCLRAVKDKLPKGQFILRISLCGQLGGHPLRWSKSKGQDWAGTTLPVQHDGNFYNVELRFNQSIAAVLPSESDVQPGMVLIFELFLLHGINSSIDQAVGWAAFPICNSQLEILEGKYKCPLLRGQRDPKIDEFRKIEDLISSDIDHWLCNLYFQTFLKRGDAGLMQALHLMVKTPVTSILYCLVVRKLPKSLVGQKEYVVEPQLSPHSPECSYASEKNESSENILGTNSGLKLLESGFPFHSNISHSISSLGFDPILYGCKLEELQTGEFSLQNNANKTWLQKKEEKKQEPATRSGFHINGNEKANLNRKAQDSCGINTGCEDVFDGLAAANSESGMFCKAIHQNPLELNTKDKRQNPVEKDRSSQVPSYLVDQDQYRFSVVSNSSPDKAVKTLAAHTRFVGRMFLEELGISHWCSPEAWLMMLLVALSWFLRLYLHYFSQWLYLQAIGVPVNRFHFYPHTVELIYQNSLLHTREELAIVALGPLTLNAAMLITAMIRWICHVLFGSFPSFLSRFIMAMGLWMVLDPLAIFIVDGILGRLAPSTDTPIADAAKLHWLFYRTQHSGIPGILITLILYMAMFVSSLTILYLYFFRLHNSGKLLDVFYRLHSSEERFLVPLDLEMSNQELNYLVKRTEQWRGINGERRKVAVYDYICNDELTMHPSCGCVSQGRRRTCGSEAGRGEIATHVSIYIIHLSGLQELYRHFLRLPDGAIVEVFGAISGTPFAGAEVDTQIERQVNNVDNVLQLSVPSELRESQKSIYNAEDLITTKNRIEHHL